MSDFGDILEQWERRRQQKRVSDTDSAAGDADRMATIIDQYPPDPSVVQDSEDSQELGDQKISAAQLPPEDSIDLHGLLAEEARRQLRRFLTESQARGLRKVLIIHGKGNHTKEPPVLKRVVQEELEASPVAGQTGTPARELGGSGATWVVVRSK